jgi:hypothetical protein
MVGKVTYLAPFIGILAAKVALTRWAKTITTSYKIRKLVQTPLEVIVE